MGDKFRGKAGLKDEEPNARDMLLSMTACCHTLPENLASKLSLSVVSTTFAIVNLCVYHQHAQEVVRAYRSISCGPSGALI